MSPDTRLPDGAVALPTPDAQAFLAGLLHALRGDGPHLVNLSPDEDGWAAEWEDHLGNLTVDTLTLVPDLYSVRLDCTHEATITAAELIDDDRARCPFCDEVQTIVAGPERVTQ